MTYAKHEKIVFKVMDDWYSIPAELIGKRVHKSRV